MQPTKQFVHFKRTTDVQSEGFFPLSTVIHIQLYQTCQFSLKLPIVEQQ